MMRRLRSNGKRPAWVRMIYGHTHRARHDYFHGNQDGTVQMYVNAALISHSSPKPTTGSPSPAPSRWSTYTSIADEDLDTKQPGTTSMDIWTGIRRKVYV
jgi:hypothetical protein